MKVYRLRNMAESGWVILRNYRELHDAIENELDGFSLLALDDEPVHIVATHAGHLVEADLEITAVEMTQEELDALPEFDGW